MLIIQLHENADASTNQTVLQGYKVKFICPYYEKSGVSNSINQNTEYDRCPYYEKDIVSDLAKPNAERQSIHPYYMMIINDISSPKDITIKRDYENKETAQNAPNEIIYKDNGGEHYFEKLSTSDNSVIWALKK